MTHTLIWYEQPTVLFERDNWKYFVPSRRMQSTTQILNALVRFSIYSFLILSVVHNDLRSIIFPISTMLFSFFLYFYTKERDIGMMSKDPHFSKLETDNTLPTLENPFMNTLLPDVGAGERKPAVDVEEHPCVKKEVEYNFAHKLYRDVGDIYNKNNGQNRFFTMPNTNEYGVSHGDTVKFANWLYTKPSPTCKEDTAFCTNTHSKYDNYKHLRSQRQFL